MKQSLKSLEGERERELERVLKSVLALVELDSIESDARVAKGNPILCLKSIENDAGGQIKARHMSVRRDAALHDLWSPVASTAEARIVPARAAAHGRVTESTG